MWFAEDTDEIFGEKKAGNGKELTLYIRFGEQEAPTKGTKATEVSKRT